MVHANAVTAFVASPLLFEPTQLRLNHITALLALAVDGPVHKVAIKLLAQAYSQQEAETIWTAWAPHLAPAPGRPLAGGTLLRDTIMQSVCTRYPTTKSAKEVAGKLVDDIAKAVVTQTFVHHTAADFFDERGDESTTPPLPFRPRSDLLSTPRPLLPRIVLPNMPDSPKEDPNRGYLHGRHTSKEVRVPH